MKLGIVVVYLFGAEHETLFDLHLRQIEKCTQIPYIIYGSVNRLALKYRQRLAEYPHVRAFEFPLTELRSMHEHSYYLDQLIQIAVDDGATHIVTLHLDSFPIRMGWIEELATRLTDTCVIATVKGINTACLVFGRDFYLQHKPTMLVSESVQTSPGFRNYIRTQKPTQHSGIGYGFAAFANKLSWYYLSLTAGDNDYGCIYNNMIFHLGHTIHLQASIAPGAHTTPSLMNRSLLCGGAAVGAAAIGRTLVPAELRRRLRKHFARWFDRILDQPRAPIGKRRNDAVMRELLKAPDAFLDKLRRQS